MTGIILSNRQARLYKATTVAGEELCFSACNDNQAKALASSYFPTFLIASVHRAS